MWLVRHGETENNVLMNQMRSSQHLDQADVKRSYESIRAADPVLSELGREQVQRLPEHPALAPLLRSGRPVALYASPLQRAIETAAGLHLALPGRPPIRLRGDLSEIGGLRSASGEHLPGMKPGELKAAFPGLILDTSELHEDGWWSSSPVEDAVLKEGCAPSWERVGRLSTWLRSLQPPEGISDVVIAGHGALFARLVPELMGAQRHSCRVEHGNTGVTVLELSGLATHVRCINAPPLAATSPSLGDGSCPS